MTNILMNPECEVWVSTTLEIRTNLSPGDYQKIDSATYYRLTPAIWGYLCRALQRATSAVTVPTEILERFEDLRRYVSSRYSPGEIRRGLTVWRTLPDREPQDDSEDAPRTLPAVTTPESPNAVAVPKTGAPVGVDQKPTPELFIPESQADYLATCSADDWEAITNAIASRAEIDDPFADHAPAYQSSGDELRESGVLRVDGRWLAVSPRDWGLRPEDPKEARRWALKLRAKQENQP